MSPRDNRPDDDFPELDARLRAEADAARPHTPAELRANILSAVRAAGEARARGKSTWVHGLAAAAIVVVFGLWIAFQLGDENEKSVTVAGQDVVQPLKRLFNLQTPRVVAEAERPLLAEAQALWSDTSSVARGIVSRLPAPLRPRSPETPAPEAAPERP